MQKNYSMQSRIRYLQGRVDVNYYNDDSSDEVSYVENADDYPCIKQYARQIVNGGIAMDKKIFVLDGGSVVAEDIDLKADDTKEFRAEKVFDPSTSKTRIKIIDGRVKSYANSRLNSDFVLCGESDANVAAQDTKREMFKTENSPEKPYQAVALGWFGTQLSDNNGNFQTAQTLFMQYSAPREIDHMVISGYNARGEYPLEFAIVYFKERSSTADEVEYLDQNFFDLRITQIELKDRENFNRKDFVVYFKPVVAKRVQLIIYRWSAANTVPKINYFASEHIECYLGDKLKSISIVEEKTGDTDKLSYGISSNSCTFEFLNENKRFYYNKDYNLLRKNRRVYTYIRCGKGDFSKPLGMFYSDEWKIEDGNPYVSCKAYDVLYSLQELQINYGLSESRDGTGKAVYAPFKCVRVRDIFERVFSLINLKRRECGIFSVLEYELDLGELADRIIPIVLIEQKSAWDLLQELANLTCSHIYCDRTGRVIVKRDNFSTPQIPESEAKKLVSVNPSNSFSYSLPVLSQTVVNSVNTEYYDLEEESEDDVLEITVKEFTTTAEGVIASVKLDKIYDNLKIVSVVGAEEYSVAKCSFNKIELNVKLLENVKEIIVKLLFNRVYSLVKNTAIEQEDTIDKFGLREFNYKAGNLLLNPENAICESFVNGTLLSMFNFAEISNKILQKYKYGVTFVDAEWTGDYNLTLDSNFCAKSQYDEDGLEEVYECISSEISYDSRFKQKVKGRESQEIIH